MLAVIASDDVETFITLNSGPLETWKYHWMDVMPEAIKSKGDKIATYILSQLDDSNYEIVHTFMFPAMIGYGKSNLVKLTVEKYPQIKKSRTVGPFWQEGMESIYRPNKGVDFYSCLGDKIGKEFLTKLLDDSLDEDFLYYVLNISVEEDNPKVFGLALKPP